MLPPFQRREDGQVLRRQRVGARRKDVGQLPFVDKDAGLALADNQFRVVFDLVAVAFEAVDERVVRVVEPLDDIDELALYFIP
jgi:hypothetical protein